MRSRHSIIVNRRRERLRRFTPALCVLILASAAAGQRTAVIAPNGTSLDNRIASEIASSLAASANAQDLGMSRAAFESAKRDDPFNMTTASARTLGRTIGADFYMLLRTVTQRRVALGKPEYYEAFAVLYTISSRTGRLIDWRLLSESAAAGADAENKLSKGMPAAAAEILGRARAAAAAEAGEPNAPKIDEPPDPDAPAAKGFRAPAPYRRLKPEYTSTAFFYEVAATVEITVDIDANGEIKRTEITRWAGFGLDESVRSTVMAMNWRPAERDGRTVPMRVLLRYNFKKLDK